MSILEFVALDSWIDAQPVRVGCPGLDLINPNTGERVAVLWEAGPEGVDQAVTAAKSAAAALRHASVFERIALINAAADAVAGAADALAKTICEDVGKPIRIAQFEVQRGINFIRACAATLSTLGSETLPLDSVKAGEGCFGFTQRVPYGVVGVITPFNAPLNLLIQKVIPAVAAGNAVVAKPAPAGSRTALLIAERLDRVWPSGLFNVVVGDRDTATALAAHPSVGAVSFTGGTAAGHALARAAGAKKFVAEMGSNAANLVFADADLDAAAGKVAVASFEASGQQCISAQRILVQRTVLNGFVERFVAATLKLKVGLAEDPSVDIGPMVSTAAADRVMAMYEDACHRGANILLAPTRQGAIVSPAILLDVPKDARLWREEVFGPVAIIAAFETEAEALALANDSEFGLQGAAFTQNLGIALRVARAFDVGALWINEASRFRLDMYPFGGVKSSGVGREGVRYAIEEMSQLQFVGIRI
jgi:acyl-CoA reductase-like NAD-dependent aldehyde dehydrogenase